MEAHPLAKADDLRELAHYASYHKLEAILSAVQQVLEIMGFNYSNDPVLQKRLEFSGFMKACVKLDYISMAHFETLLGSFDGLFRTHYVNMKKYDINFFHWIAKREKIVRQIGLSLLYNQLGFTFGRYLPDLPSQIELPKRFRFAVFESQLENLLKTKELSYPFTQSELKTFKETFKGRNLEELRDIIEKNKLSKQMIFKLFAENSLDSFESDIVSFMTWVESMALPIPSLTIQWSGMDASTALPRASSSLSAPNAVVGDWDDETRRERGPYAGATPTRRVPESKRLRHEREESPRNDKIPVSHSSSESASDVHTRKKKEGKSGQTPPPSARRTSKRVRELEEVELQNLCKKSNIDNTGEEEKASLSPKKGRGPPPSPSKRRESEPSKYAPQTGTRTFWSQEESDALMAGVKKHGKASWATILDDPQFAILRDNFRTNVNLKDRYRSMTK